MGGKDAIRGFEIQIAVALSESLVTPQEWDTVEIEPSAVSEKVDLLWVFPGGRKRHVQIKARSRPFTRAGVDQLAADLAAASPGADTELVLVGPTTTEVTDGSVVRGVKITIRPPDLRDVEDAARYRLVTLLERECEGDPPPTVIITQVWNDLLHILRRGAVSGRRVGRRELITELLRASQSALEAAGDRASHVEYTDELRMLLFDRRGYRKQMNSGTFASMRHGVVLVIINILVAATVACATTSLSYKLSANQFLVLVLASSVGVLIGTFAGLCFGIACAHVEGVPQRASARAGAVAGGLATGIAAGIVIVASPQLRIPEAVVIGIASGLAFSAILGVTLEWGLGQIRRTQSRPYSLIGFSGWSAVIVGGAAFCVSRDVRIALETGGAYGVSLLIFFLVRNPTLFALSGAAAGGFAVFRAGDGGFWPAVVFAAAFFAGCTTDWKIWSSTGNVD